MENSTKKLYAEIAAHTWALCEKSCRNKEKSKCCSEIICATMARNLREQGLPVPPRVGTPRFLGPNGCILEPWQRPLCAKYHCWYNGVLGPVPHAAMLAVDPEWVVKFYRLLDAIEHAE